MRYNRTEAVQRRRFSDSIANAIAIARHLTAIPFVNLFKSLFVLMAIAIELSQISR